MQKMAKTILVTYVPRTFDMESPSSLTSLHPIVFTFLFVKAARQTTKESTNQQQYSVLKVTHILYKRG